MNAAPTDAWTNHLLVALDIDGTLMHPDGYITEEVHQAVDLARAAGHHLVLASGRSLVGLLPVAERLGLTDGHAVASNGALTIRLEPDAPGGHRFTRTQLFDPAAVIRAALLHDPSVRVAVEEPGWGWRVNRLFNSDVLNGEQKCTSVADLCATPATRVVLSAPAIRQHLDALGGAGVTVTPAGPGWLDVTGAGVSKATALEQLRTKLGVPQEGTIAIGDGTNDIEALTWAARGIAMGHASAPVRSAADEVTGTIDEDGAATVLKSLVDGTVDTSGWSPLPAQLAIGVATAPGPVLVRVQQGAGAALERAEILTFVAGRWRRHGAVPAAAGLLMLDVTNALDAAGLEFPRTDLGLRARWTRTETDSDRPSFDLPLWQARRTSRIDLSREFYAQAIHQGRSGRVETE
ncbi:HAD family hydrolase [Promicromonospora aerolata]|uniref:HAD family hydrolase n=1 Tax=Promicromonospora aerolata TaxID=195749 RepID=A0ABW4VFE6_9MICO